jgi:hypothetical membrane protein
MSDGGARSGDSSPAPEKTTSHGVPSGAAFLLAAVVTFAVVLLIEQAVRPGYSPVRDPIALLGIGDPTLSAVFNGALLLLGVATGVFAASLPSTYSVERPCVLALGAVLVLAGLFPLSFSFHWVLGLLLYALPAAAIWAFLVDFLRSRRRRLVWFTSVIILVSAAGLFLTLTDLYGGGDAGAAERLIDYSGLVWGGTISAGSLANPRLLYGFRA